MYSFYLKNIIEALPGNSKMWVVTIENLKAVQIKANVVLIAHARKNTNKIISKSVKSTIYDLINNILIVCTEN